MSNEFARRHYRVAEKEVDQNQNDCEIFENLEKKHLICIAGGMALIVFLTGIIAGMLFSKKVYFDE